MSPEEVLHRQVDETISSDTCAREPGEDAVGDSLDNPLAVYFPTGFSAARLGKSSGMLSQRVYGLIRTNIIDHSFPPGTRLIERMIAEHLGVSRVPVREALRDLVRDGFVEIHDRRGVMVPRLNRHDLQSLVEVREALDVLLFLAYPVASPVPW